MSSADEGYVRSLVSGDERKLVPRVCKLGYEWSRFGECIVERQRVEKIHVSARRADDEREVG